MIPGNRTDVLEVGLAVLADFAAHTSARGRFIALYLGLRRMGGDLAQLGSGAATSSREIEEFMDALLTKQHRSEPFVVLTAPFGGSVSPTAPYSTRTGVVAPGNSTATNTWRNNFGIQKGVGCPAEAEVIRSNLDDPALRLACPYIATDPEGQYLCSVESTSYRGEEHSIWLRKTGDGWQVVDLDHPQTYGPYLRPGGAKIPVFALIAVMYGDAPSGVYPQRANVGIPDFAADFDFSLDQARELFDCDPQSTANATVLRAAEARLVVSRPVPPEAGPDAPEPDESDVEPGDAILPPGDPMPELLEPGLRNSGLEAELDVAEDLALNHWTVTYRGRQAGVGYDLEADAESGSRLRVEVKSSVGFTTPELTQSEWAAAQRYGSEYVLAVVDFVGSPQQAIWYVRDPAGNASPTERVETVYRLPRTALMPLSTDAEFL